MTMLRDGQWRPFRLLVSLCAVAGLLTGCAQGQFSTQASRIGVDDGTDACRPALVALDSTGNYFGAQILTGAAMGAAGGALAGVLIGGNLRSALIGAAAGGALGAAGGYWSALQQQNRDQAAMFSQVEGDLSRENAQIDRTQLAFDQLTDCRFRQAQTIRADYRAHRIDRATAEAAMAVVRQRAQRDLAVAQNINRQIAGRGDQFVVAADNLAPGTRAAIAAPPPPRRVVLRRAVPLKLHPDETAPDIGQLKARQPVTVSSTRGGFALVETASGERGYAPDSALVGRLPPPVDRPPPTGASGTADVRSLAGSNAARRDSFAMSVAVTEQATNSGFELAG
jgi:hypothetical protein